MRVSSHRVSIVALIVLAMTATELSAQSTWDRLKKKAKDTVQQQVGVPAKQPASTPSATNSSTSVQPAATSDSSTGAAQPATSAATSQRTGSPTHTATAEGIYTGYCYVRDGATTFYSDVFALPADRNNQDQLALVLAFDHFISTTYHPPTGTTNCLLGREASLADEQRQKERKQRQFAGGTGMDKQGQPTETAWTPSKGPPSMNWEPARTDATNGPTVWVFCTDVSKKLFISPVFAMHGKEAAMSTDRYRALLSASVRNPFGSYVNSLQAAGSGGEPNCDDGYPSAATAAKVRAERIEGYTKQNGAGSVMEVVWNPANACTPTVLHPCKQTVQEAAITSSAQTEHLNDQRTIAEGMCSKNAIASFYDCSCFADKVMQYRAEHPEERALSNTIRKVNYDACVGPTEPMSQYAYKRASDTLRADPAKEAIAQCVAARVPTAFKAKPSISISLIDGLMLNAMQACKQ